MASPTRPTSTVPNFATDLGTRATLTSTRQGTGWQAGERPPAEILNGVEGPLCDWVNYIKQFHTGDDEFSIGRIVGIGDPGASGTDLYITSSSGEIRVEPASGESVSLYANSAGGTLDLQAGTPGFNATLMFDADTGTITSQGLQASPNTDTGVRYAYPVGDPREITLDVGLTNGGYGPLMADIQGSSAEIIYGTTGSAIAEAVVFVVSGAGPFDILTRRNLEKAFQDADADAASTVRIQAVELTSTWGGAGTSATEIQLIQRLRGSPYAEVGFLQVTRASTSNNNGGTPIDLDLSTYEYFIQTRDGDLGTGGTSGSVASDEMVSAQLTLRLYSE